jgi:PAP2 superfamily
MWMPWKPAVGLAVAFLLAGLIGRSATGPRARLTAAMAREASLILGLYAIWQLAGALSVMQVTGAEGRGRRIVSLQHSLFLPSEVSLQKLILPHPLWVQFCNGYYAIVHVPALVAFLLWAFVRDRNRYARWRTTMALATAACLAIQLIPVAPPRMLVDLGFVDTALLYRQSVYSALGRGMAGQLAAMPSVHVAWAVIVALGMWQITTSRWRWLGVAHAVMTVLVVSATANHYWLDGIVAVCLIGVAAGLQVAARIFLPVATVRSVLVSSTGGGAADISVHCGDVGSGGGSEDGYPGIEAEHDPTGSLEVTRL